MAIKRIVESEGEVSDKIKDVHDRLISKGFKRNNFSEIYGVDLSPEAVEYSKDLDDLYIIISDDDVGEGYVVDLIGDGEDNYSQGVGSLSFCLKVAHKAEQFFDEYPTTRKFMQKFADDYDLQYGY